MTSTLRNRPLPTTLHIHTPAQAPFISLVLQDDSPPTTLSPSTDDSDLPPFRRKPSRNMKKLSITLPTQNDLVEPPTGPLPPNPLTRPRRPSIISLPPIANPTSSLLHRKDEDGGSPNLPYADGPIQIIPGIWLGSEENARDWNGLIERGIKSVLNVAKEVASPFDTASKALSLRTVSSTPNFRNFHEQDPTYYPPHIASGRPPMHYLKLQWSHGQQDLVESGFQEAMQFTDAALERSEGILIHCQCGISRSATMVIALVMRAAAEKSPSVPPEVWALKGMQEAYAFVKEKSACVGPNMQLIYQLLAYEKKLKGDSVSPENSEPSSATDEEEEWGRRRRMLDDPSAENAQESTLVMQEAHALDKAMEDRIVARKASASSITSTGSGVGMGAVWRSRYGSRKRTGSIASSKTNGSIISEDLVEEEEERELLGIGGGFDDEARSRRSSGLEDLSVFNSPDDDEIEQAVDVPPLTARASASHAPSAPVWKTSFHLPPPATAVHTSFDLPPRRSVKSKRRPAPIGILPPVPPSPITLVVESERPALPIKPSVRKRAESQKLAPPPLHLRGSILRRASALAEASAMPTPSQTLFVFPPSPTLTTRTPSTMTLTSNISGPLPFPSLSTPRVSTFRSHGRTRSFIGLGASPIPTVGFSKVDARGFLGLS